MHAPISLPPWAEIVACCARLAAAVPQLTLPDHHLTLMQLRPYRMAQGWSMRPHEHSYYEASIVLEGAARSQYGQVLTPGSLFFHGPHILHAWSTPDAPCMRLIVGFNMDPPAPMRRPGQWPHWPDLLYDIAQLLQAISAGRPGWRDESAARLAVIVARLLTLCELPSPEVRTFDTGDTFVHAIEAFLIDNLQHRMQLQDIAACLGCSTSSLTHRYRQRTGMTVGQRMLTLRMERAAHLLTTTPLSLDAICEAVGITDPPYLCRLFKRYYRMSPGEYRHPTQESALG